MILYTWPIPTQPTHYPHGYTRLGNSFSLRHLIIFLHYFSFNSYLSLNQIFVISSILLSSYNSTMAALVPFLHVCISITLFFLNNWEVKKKTILVYEIHTFSFIFLKKSTNYSYSSIISKQETEIVISNF